VVIVCISYVPLIDASVAEEAPEEGFIKKKKKKKATADTLPTKASHILNHT
jgi:hypothetical protein